jgi:hypothetical protein
MAKERKPKGGRKKQRKREEPVVLQTRDLETVLRERGITVAKPTYFANEPEVGSEEMKTSAKTN